MLLYTYASAEPGARNTYGWELTSPLAGVPLVTTTVTITVMATINAMARILPPHPVDDAFGHEPPRRERGVFRVVEDRIQRSGGAPDDEKDDGEDMPCEHRDGSRRRVALDRARRSAANEQFDRECGDEGVVEVVRDSRSRRVSSIAEIPQIRDGCQAHRDERVVLEIDEVVGERIEEREMRAVDERWNHGPAPRAVRAQGVRRQRDGVDGCRSHSVPREDDLNKPRRDGEIRLAWVDVPCVCRTRCKDGRNLI